MSGVAAEVEVGCSCQVGDGVGVLGKVGRRRPLPSQIENGN